MARSHPPTLIRIAERALREECALRPGERILVAASGGGDSSALLHVLALASARLRVSVAAHGVDHGLRPEAAAELDAAAALAEALGVPFGRTRLNVAPGGNLQARARAARREALEAAAGRCAATRIATAHHADDRAETVLIRLLHGASPQGLAVLPAAEGAWIRPFIRARKNDVRAHLERHRITHAEDPSNVNRRFLRVRVRLDLLPLLVELSPAVVDHLTALADELGAGPLPPMLDEAGRPVSLRRAHVREIRRALRLGVSADVLLEGGREVRVDPKAHELRVTRRSPEPHAVGRAPAYGRRVQKGGAKTGKSG